MRPKLPVLVQETSLQQANKPIDEMLDLLSKVCKEATIAPLIQESAIAIYDLQLGDSLPGDRVDPSSLYFICQGRVRLLSQDDSLQREISVQLLEAGSAFGADDLGDHAPLSYRIVAASAVQIACLPTADLERLRHQFPAFQHWLRQQVEQRQWLIFLKTRTDLRALSGRQLEVFLSAIETVQVPAGTLLNQVTGKEDSYFWLRQGSVQSADGQAIPTVGTGWGDTELPTETWMAQTEVWLYKLAIADWEALNFLRQAPATSANESFKHIAPAQSGAIALTSTPLPVAPLPTIPKLENNVVAFPTPVRRRWRRSLWQHYPFIEQQSSSDCGVACLAMVSRYWGKQFPLPMLREKASVGQSGASLKNLAKTAEAIGFHARPVRASFNRVAEQSHPWIAHWQGDHYVVVYQVRQGNVVIADPAVGRRTLSHQEFQENWTGYALLLEPGDRLYNTDVPKASLGRYLTTLGPYRSVILQIVLISLLIQIFGLVTPLLTQIILDRVVVQKSLNSLNVFALGLLLFGIWSIGITAVRHYLLSYFSNRLDLTLISGFISHTLLLPLKFFESRRVGDIITRVQENQKIQRFLVNQVVVAFLDFFTGFIYLGLMLYYSPRLTLLVLALIPPIILLTLAATPLLRKVSREIFKESADQNSLLVEMMSGIAMVKGAAVEQEMRWQWEDHLTRQMNAQFRGQKLGIRLEAISGVIHSVGGTALLWFGAYLVIQGELTIGQLVAFNMMMGYIITPIVSLANLWDELQEVVISVERLNDVFDATPEESPQQLLLPLPALRGEVILEEVTFRYDEDQETNTLQGISLEVAAGETIAIVGSSGSGKTTLMKLLQGLYQPTRGKVVIDGHDIRHVSPASLRSQIGVVPQECFLFSSTILENIRLYRSGISLEDVVEVAKLAEAHAFIQAMPLSYNTKVGERGSTLSGGQRQRIAIARALLGNPRILILDEATSSLDTESERRFQRNLAQIRRDRTTFIVAHRLSTVRNADRILVLDRGVIAEQGNHDELMVLKGLYYHLVQQQLAL